MNRPILLAAVILLLVVCSAFAMAQEAAQGQPGAEGTPAEQESRIHLTTVGVPDGLVDVTGRYDLKNNIFMGDVSEIDGAYFIITYDDVIITGTVIEHRKQDNYLLVTGNVRIEQKDLILVGDKVEIYTELEQIFAYGNLEVETNDAFVRAEG